MFRVLRIFSATLAFTLIPLTVVAQPGPGGQSKGARKALLMQRIHEVRLQLLQTEVGLDPAAAKSAAGVIRGFDGLRRGFMRSQRQARQEIRRLLESSSNDMKRYRAAVAQMRQAHGELQQLRIKEFDALVKVLTPRQSALLVLGLERVKRKLRKRLRAMKRDRRDRRGRGRGGF